MRLSQLCETSRVLYHGTSQPGAFHKIIQNGLIGRAAQERYSLAPIKGRVYMTPQLRTAIVYAIGGDMLGSKLPEHMVKPGERYGYVFEIDSTDLTDDIMPDEDIVGQALVAAHRFQKTGKINTFSELDVELLDHPQLMRDLAYVFDTFTRDVPSIRKGAVDGMIADQARLGKRVLKKRGVGDLTMRQLLKLAHTTLLQHPLTQPGLIRNHAVHSTLTD